jgi:hypothetical protein
MSEDLDKKEQFIDRVLSILDKPYIKSLNSIGIDDRDTQKVILSKLFNDNVTIQYGINDISVYNSNGDKVYYEDSNGEWYKREYDLNGNQIYYEDSDGYWYKIEYDYNGKEIYYEDSDGEWSKTEYDSNGNDIYYENSDGDIIDRRNNINESEDKREQFIDKVLSILDKPYFKSLNSIGIDDRDTQKVILSKLYNDNISIEYGNHYVNTYNSNRKVIYNENSEGDWVKKEYDSNGNEIYYEDNYGEWVKTEYDSNGNQIYYEDNYGRIVDKRNNINESEDKKDVFVNRVLSILELPYIKSLNSIGIDDEDTQKLILSKLFNDNVTIEYVDDYVDIYNSNGNKIYYEHSSGYWFKKEYDSNGKRIYYENSEGYWVKYEYDSKGNLIYFEDSDGYWYKYEYDSNGNLIYYENSDGIIVDRRNNINESEDKKEQFINKVLSILDTPYFMSLDSIGIDDEDIQKLIFSRLFNDDVTIEYGVDDIEIYNSNGKEIYYEKSDGQWSKREYDSRGNKIYYEDYEGYWVKYEYDSKGNLIYYENSDGFWEKWEYDSNGNLIYYENSDGDWDKYEYDSNGNKIYYEDSKGIIMDKRNNINESEDKKEQFINKLLSILDTPYFKSLNSMGIDDIDTQKLILSRLFNDDVIIKYYDYEINIYNSNGNEIYSEDSEGEWVKYEYDSKGRIVYHESSSGFWMKKEFNSKGNEIYYENSNGVWFKTEYDSDGNRIYLEDSNGKIIDKRNNINESEDKRDVFIERVLSILELPYIKSLNSIGIDDENIQKLIFSKLFNDNVTIEYGDHYVDIYNSNGNEIYSEKSNGQWSKREYDTYGNKIYYEDSEGNWNIREYDTNGSRIYYEDSNGKIIDRRNKPEI